MGHADLEHEETTVPFSLSMRQKIGLALGAYIFSVLVACVRMGSTRIGPGNLFQLAILAVSVFLAGLVLRVMKDAKHLHIGKAKAAKLAVLMGSCVAVVLAIVYEDRMLTMIFELLGLVSLFLILKDIPGPRLSEPLRREARYFLVGGAIGSLGTMAVCSLSWGLFMWVTKGILSPWPRFLFPGTPQFILLGTVLGAAYVAVSSRIPLPTVASGLLYGFVVYLFLASLSALLPSLPSHFIIYPYYHPALALQAVPWLVYGLALGFFAWVTGFRSGTRFSAPQSAAVYALVFLLLVLAVLVWAYPAVVGASAKGATLTSDQAPPGYRIVETEEVSVGDRILTRLNRDLFGEAAWIPYPRLHQWLESVDPSGQSGKGISVVVGSSTRSISARYLSRRNQTIAGGLDGVTVQLPRLGDGWVAWESSPNPAIKQLVFSMGAFLVEIRGSPLHGPEISATWDEVVSVARMIEAHLEALG